MIVNPTPTYFYLFSRLKIKLKGHHFEQLRWLRENCRWCWTPSQNRTTRMHIKNGGNIENSAYTWKGTTSRVMVTSRLKVSFWPDGSTRTGNYGLVFVYIAVK
jgi:hypothetical protein